MNVMNALIKYPNLNKKKVTIAIASIVFFLLLIIIIIVNCISSHNEEPGLGEEIGNSRIFYDKNRTISIETSKDYDLRQYYSYTNYLFELRNSNDLNIFVSKIENDNERTLEALARADRTTYIKEFSSISNLADLKLLTINENEAATYSFHYLDSNQNKAFYLQVVFMNVNNNIYVFDFDFPLDDLNSYSTFITDFLSSFKIL
jgi:hypothetical protein